MIMKKKIQPPMIPVLSKDPLDISNFDKAIIKEEIEYTEEITERRMLKEVEKNQIKF